MNLKSFIEGMDEPHNELDRLLDSRSVGAQASRIAVDERLDARELRRMIKRYANCSEGPFGARRLALYRQTQYLFDALRRGPAPTIKPYELKDSFISDDEANLILLTCSHERRSQQSIAEDTLHCSPNTVGTRRADIADGTRVAGMCVQAEFGYRGQFQSSVHPVVMPLNLSEVYVLLKALKNYEQGRLHDDPHAAIARRVANMVFGELSDYAKERLTPRFDEAGYSFEPVDPIFQEGLTEEASRVYFEKAQVPIRVTLTDGDQIEGVIAPNAVGDEAADKQGRPLFALKLMDGSVRHIPWKDVLTIDRA